MNSTLLKYDIFLSFINEGGIPTIESVDKVVYGTSLLLEKRTSGKRLLDHIDELQVNEELGYATLTEEEKYETENVLWEGVVQCMMYEGNINEAGFWDSVFGAISDFSKRALNFAKSIIQNIAGLVKSIGNWIVEYFKKAKEVAISAASSAFGTLKSKLENKFTDRKKQYSEEAIKQEGGELNATVEWFTKKSADTTLATGAKDAESAAVAADKADSKEKEKIQKQIAAELEGGKKEGSKNESMNLTYMRVINEIRANEDWDFSAMISEANDYSDLCKIIAEEQLIAEASDEELVKREEEIAAKKPEPTVDDDPKAGAEEKKKGILARLKESFSISKVIAVFTSGIVYFFELAVEFLLREKAFPKLSAWVKKAGGPGVFKFAILAGVIAVILGSVAEFGLETISELTGVKAFEHIAHALHSVNPLHLVDHAVMHIPGGSTYAKAIAVVVVTYMGFNHIKHLLHHKHDVGDEMNHEEAAKIEKNEISADEKELEKTDDEGLKNLLNQRIDLNKKFLKFHNTVKGDEEDIHHLESEIKQMKKDKEDEDTIKAKEKELEEKKENIKKKKIKYTSKDEGSLIAQQKEIIQKIKDYKNKKDKKDKNESRLFSFDDFLREQNINLAK